MGTISDKTTYLNTTKTLIREKINDLGQNLDTEDTFRSYAEALEQVYEDYPKTTTTNVTEPSINNTKAGKMEIDLKGNTEQFTTTGKNLLPIYNQNVTINNVNFKATDTGSLLVTGTSNAIIGGANFVRDDFKVTLPAGTYTLSRSSIIDRTVGLVKSDGSTSIVEITRTSTDLYRTFTVNEEIVGYLYFYIPTNTSVNFDVKLQLEQGSTATSFEPYTGGTASPNPDYPQDVEVVSGKNKVKIVNKNLFDKNNTTNNYWLLTDGTIEAHTGFVTSDFIKIKSNTNYYITNTRTRRLKYYDINKNALTSDWDLSTAGAQSFTTLNNASYVRFCVDTDLVSVDTVQLEQGSTATTYEEHKEQDFPISLSSRNLLKMNETRTLNGITVTNNGDGSITVNGTATKTMYFFIANGLEAQVGLVKAMPNGTTLTQRINEISGSYSAGNVYIETVTYNGTSNNYTNLRGNISYTFTYDGWIRATDMYVQSGVTFDNWTIKPQLEEGSTATEYQPYYNYELCEIGDYQDYPWKDENTGKWYIHSLFQKIVFDNDSQIATGSSSTDGYARVGFGSSYDIGFKGNDIIGVYCNKFKGLTQNENTPSITGQHWYVSNAEPDRFRIMFRSGDSSLTGEQLTTLIKTSGVYIYCFRKNEIDIEITDTTLISQLEAIYNTAKSYDNVTNIIQENNDLPFILEITTLKKS